MITNRERLWRRKADARRAAKRNALQRVEFARNREIADFAERVKRSLAGDKTKPPVSFAFRLASFRFAHPGRAAARVHSP
jgi:hypothetical protein